jgi:hypothetical protein
MCRRFGTLCSIFIGGVSRKKKLDPRERIQHSEHGESFKSRTTLPVLHRRVRKQLRNYYQKTPRNYYQNTTNQLKKNIAESAGKLINESKRDY